MRTDLDGYVSAFTIAQVRKRVTEKKTIKNDLLFIDSFFLLLLLFNLNRILLVEVDLTKAADPKIP